MKVILRKCAMSFLAVAVITATVPVATLSEVNDAPQPLAWDDFSFYNSSGRTGYAEEGWTPNSFEQAPRVITGGPVDSSGNNLVWQNDGWGSWRDGSKIVFHSTNTHDVVNPLTYGELQASGVIAAVNFNNINNSERNGKRLRYGGDGQATDNPLKDYFGQVLNDEPNLGGVDKTLWFSVLMRRDGTQINRDTNLADGDQSEHAEIILSLKGPEIRDTRLGIGYSPGTRGTDGKDYWGLKYFTDLDTDRYVPEADGVFSFSHKASGLPVSPNEPVLAVVKIDFKSQLPEGENKDTVSVYFNPPKESLGNANITDFSSFDSNNLVTIELPKKLSFNTIGAAAGHLHNSDAFTFGEFRLGDSYASVTPVGEHPINDAEPLIYDNFIVGEDASAQVDGATLTARDSGEGWTNGWVNGDNAKIVNTKSNVYVNPLTYGDLEANGVFMTPFNGTSSSYPVRMLDKSVLNDYITSGGDIGSAKGDKVLWTSVLMRKENLVFKEGEEGYFAFTSNDSATTEQLAVGYFDDETTQFTIQGYSDSYDYKANGQNMNNIQYDRKVHYWSLRYPTNEDEYEYVASKYPVMPGHSMLAVTKFTFKEDGKTDVKVYFNPVKDSLSFFPPPTLKDGKLTKSLSAELTGDSAITIAPNGIGLCYTGEENEFIAGEIRIGRTYGAVTPVGEHPAEDTLLLWEDFTYPDPIVKEEQKETLAANNAPKSHAGSGDFAFPIGDDANRGDNQYQSYVTKLTTGGPLGVGWRERNYYYNDDKRAWGETDRLRIVNTIANDESEVRVGEVTKPMEYSNVKTSGVYAFPNGEHTSLLNDCDLRTIETLDLHYESRDGGNPYREGYAPLPIFSDYISPADDGEPIIGKTDNALWFSYLIRTNELKGLDGVSFGAAVFSSHGTLSRDGRVPLAIGHFPDATASNNSKWGIWGWKTQTANNGQDGIIDISDSNMADYYTTIFAIGEDSNTVENHTTVLVVAKIEFKAGDTEQDKVTAWFNPDFSSLGTAEPTGGLKAEYTYPEGVKLAIRSFGFTSRDYKGFAGDFRFGTSYRAVTPLGRLPGCGLQVVENEVGSITYDINQTGETPKIIIGIYDTSNEVITNVKLIETATAEKEKYSVYKVDLSEESITCGQNQEIRAFIWDGFTNMIPKADSDAYIYRYIASLGTE